MPIEDVFSISGRGTVVTGRVERGIIKVGEEVEIVGIRPTVKTTCTGVEMFRKLLDQGQAGDNIGALLRGTKRDEVERGQVLAAPKSITPHKKFKAEVYVLSKEVLSSTSVPPTSPVSSLLKKALKWLCPAITLPLMSSSFTPSPWKRASASLSAKVVVPSALVL